MALGCSGGAGQTEDNNCAAECTGRSCGPDPVCGKSCGTCEEGMCTEGGQCSISDPDGPQIISLNTSRSVLLPGEDVLISAIVTDPDGVSDVIGGNLLSEDGSTYGVFVTSAEEGAYSMTVTWTDFEDQGALESGMSGGHSVDLRVQFYDQAGHITEQSLPIGFGCPRQEDAICDGSCVDLQTNKLHCGACFSIIDILDGDCTDGMASCGDAADGYTVCTMNNNNVCIVADTHNCGCDNDCTVNVYDYYDPNVHSDYYSSCVFSDQTYSKAQCRFDLLTTSRKSCSQVCSGAGLSCATFSGVAGFAFYGTDETLLTSCSQTPASSNDGDAFTQVECRCVENKIVPL
jgi:hypothetical protein